jgi:hypothetical protein
MSFEDDVKLRTYGQATVTLTFTGFGPGRKALLNVQHPGMTTIETKQLFKYNSAGNETLVTNAWTNENTTGAGPFVHTCEFLMVDQAGWSYQARVVLKVLTADVNYSNPVAGGA